MSREIRLKLANAYHGKHRSSNEEIVSNILRGYNILHETNYPIDVYSVDIAFVGSKLAIEIDGGWHTALRDEKKSNFIRESGWRLIRLRGSNWREFSDLADLLVAYVEQNGIRN